MKFGENLGYYRKKLGITQEELAERMNVSRQTVSRWETDSNYPDVETLVRLCDVFGCDLDMLVRKDAEASDVEADEADPLRGRDPEADRLRQAYDRHMNRFALVISSGVALIIVGVALLMLISGFFTDGALAVSVLLLMIAVAVGAFIFAGIDHDEFMKSNPRITDYPQEARRAFNKKGAWIMSVATVLVFAAIVALIIMCNDGAYPSGISEELWEHIALCVFMTLIAAAVFLYVFGGLMFSKYDVKQYNKECISEDYSDEEKYPVSKNKRICDSICSVIMMLATALFLLLSFLKGLWHPAWVAFPVGGILCGICSEIFEAIDRSRK